MGSYYSCGSQLYIEVLHVLRSKEINILYYIFIFETFIFSLPHGTMVAESVVRQGTSPICHTMGVELDL